MEAVAPALKPHAGMGRLPTLENGDRLSPEEFRRRYELRPDIKKAELINGVVYLGSPVRLSHHGEPHAILMMELGNYRRTVSGVRLGDNATVRFQDGGEIQPDGFLRYTGRRSGRSRLTADYVYDAPELCVEVSGSTASYDLHEKMDLYRRHGVQEYLVWRVDDEAIDWWELSDDTFIPLPPGADGVTRGKVFPGLNINLDALVEELRDLWRMEEPVS